MLTDRSDLQYVCGLRARIECGTDQTTNEGNAAARLAYFSYGSSRDARHGMWGSCWDTIMCILTPLFCVSGQSPIVDLTRVQCRQLGKMRRTLSVHLSLSGFGKTMQWSWRSEGLSRRKSDSRLCLIGEATTRHRLVAYFICWSFSNPIKVEKPEKW